MGGFKFQTLSLVLSILGGNKILSQKVHKINLHSGCARTKAVAIERHVGDDHAREDSCVLCVIPET